jgi:hypothetical protein
MVRSAREAGSERGSAALDLLYGLLVSRSTRGSPLDGRWAIRGHALASIVPNLCHSPQSSPCIACEPFLSAKSSDPPCGCDCSQGPAPLHTGTYARIYPNSPLRSWMHRETLVHSRYLAAVHPTSISISRIDIQENLPSRGFVLRADLLEEAPR